MSVTIPGRFPRPMPCPLPPGCAAWRLDGSCSARCFPHSHHHPAVHGVARPRIDRHAHRPDRGVHRVVAAVSRGCCAATSSGSRPTWKKPKHGDGASLPLCSIILPLLAQDSSPRRCHVHLLLERVLLRLGADPIARARDTAADARQLRRCRGAGALQPALAAASLLAAIPSLAFFAVIQRRLVSGLLSGAVKG